MRIEIRIIEFIFIDSCGGNCNDFFIIGGLCIYCVGVFIVCCYDYSCFLGVCIVDCSLVCMGVSICVI